MSKVLSLAIVLRMRALAKNPHARREDTNEVMLAAAERIAELERQVDVEVAKIAAALACYGPDPLLPLGVSRYRDADGFLIAIRDALTATKEKKK